MTAPFCQKDGLHARVSGNLTDHTLQVTSVTMLPAPAGLTSAERSRGRVTVMATKLYTAIFNHMEGTHVAQVRVESVDQVLEAWLTAMKTETTHLLGRVAPISVLGFFDSLTESRRSFEQQLRDAIGRGEGLTALSEESVWCASFLITLLDVEHTERCTALTARGRSDPDCPACFEGASHMCELYVVETGGS